MKPDNNLEQIFDYIYVAKSKEDFFDGICYLQNFIEKNGEGIFFENRKNLGGGDFVSLKNQYSVDLIWRFWDGELFKVNIKEVLRYKRDYLDFDNIPNKILENCILLNSLLNLSFYLIANFSNIHKQKNISFFGKSLNTLIKKIEKDLLFEFDIVDILKVLETVIFDARFSYKKDYPVRFYDGELYKNLTKTRLIIGNYLVDISLPILVSNCFNKIFRLIDRFDSDFYTTEAVKQLFLALKKYRYLKKVFLLKEDFCNNNNIKDCSEIIRELGSFDYYFENRESNKIFFLLERVVNGLEYIENEEKSFSDKVLYKISESGLLLEEVEIFFINNFNAFSKTKKNFDEKQWSNKSFLNTLKFLSLLKVIDKSNNNDWKIKTFMKYFYDWVKDIHDNVNYFSEIDDYDYLKKFLKAGEDNLVEYKSTFGLPVQEYNNKEHFNKIQKETLNKIADTILAMANTSGGNIFIGIVERSHYVKDEEIFKELVFVENNCFLDVDYSLEKEKQDLDSKRLALQQRLKLITCERIDFLDSLFSFNFIKIFSKEKQCYIKILEIKVKKSDRLIFLRKHDEKIEWVTMPKRLNGRVEMVNPQEEIRKIIEKDNVIK